MHLPHGRGGAGLRLLHVTSISRTISELVPRPPKVVRNLPFAVLRTIAEGKDSFAFRAKQTMTKLQHAQRTWIKGGDFRIICDCQMHARRERALLRRAVRAARGMKRRSVAFAVALPLVFGAIGIPMEAMNLSLPALANRIATTTTAYVDGTKRTFTIVTPRVREEFLAPAAPQPLFTFTLAKEEFFRSRVPYGSIIYQEALKNDLPPELVAAVVEAESDFRPRLVSDRNAQGLMQIIPSTGRLMGADDLFNPNQNIAAGTKYLRYLVDRFGDERTALAAYNAGEGAVIKSGNAIPPYAETRAYVPKVLEYYDRYRTGSRI